MRTFLFTLILFGTATVQAQAEDVVITNAWLAATPPGALSGAGFMTVTNGAQAMQLVAAESKVAREVQLHHYNQSTGGSMSRMERVMAIDLEPEVTLEFKRGDLHLMLFGLKAPLEPNDEHTVTLRFADGTVIEHDFIVRDARDELP